MKNQIQLTQKPIVKYDFVSIGKEVKEEIKSLNLENLIVSADTIKSLKEKRAYLNKMKASLDADVKAALSPLNEVVDGIKGSYKENILVEFKDADDALKDAIGKFEMNLKDNIKIDLELYFKELCQSEKIDFVKFSQVGLNINLSTTPKKYKTVLNEYIEKVQEDIKLIESEEFQAEIMAEYKTTLNASKAITDLRARKATEKIEKDRILAKRTQERETMLRKWNMSYHDMTKTFILANNDSIVIKQSDIETLSNEDWQSHMIVLDLRIKEANANTKKETTLETVINAVAPKEIKEALSAPKEIIKEETFKAKFEVTGTMSQLKSVGEFMKLNFIDYKTID